MKKLLIRAMGATPAVLTTADATSTGVMDWKDLTISIFTLLLSFFGDKIFPEKK